MMKKTLFPLFYILFFVGLQAQDRKTSLTFSPATISMPEWAMALQPGLQRQLNSRVAVVGEFCFPIVPIVRSSDISHQTYFRVKGELKYYLHANPSSAYASIESSYAYRQFKVLSGSYYEAGKFDSVVTYQSADVLSPIWITNLKIGREYEMSPQMRFDVFIGMGFRNIRTDYSDAKETTRVPNQLGPICKIFPSPDAAWHYEGSIYRFNATFGFRLMYQF